VADSVEHQRDVTRLLLSVLGDAGFALAGSGAIREHGLSARPTEDVDLFTSRVGAEIFSDAISRGAEILEQNSYQVVETRRADQYAQLNVTAPDGHVLEVDLGLDWRAHDPVRLEVGPVLALPDAVANKVGALYSRAEVRDYLDLDSIRQSGAFTDEQLLKMTADHDAGFELPMFASQLARVRELTAKDVAEYGVDAEQLAGLKERLSAWATHIHSAPQTGKSHTRLTTQQGLATEQPLAGSIGSGRDGGTRRRKSIHPRGHVSPTPPAGPTVEWDR